MSAQKIHPSRIGFDFDGVIADTAEAFIRIACHQYEYCDIKLDDITHFQVEQCTDMDIEIVNSIFTQILLDSIGSKLMPMPGAINVLEEMAEVASVTVITARTISEPVTQWFQKHMEDSATKNIRLVAMGDHNNKPRFAKELNLTHFIDDRAETCLQLQETGIRSILFSQPWNRSSHHQLPKVNSWEEIRTLCL